MREITKIIQMPAGNEKKNFRLTKLDAFSGIKVLKLLAASNQEDLQSLLFSLKDEELDQVMKTCLSHAEVELPAGYIKVWDQGCWGSPELEHETVACFRLTQEVLAWTLSGFFPESGSPS